jgi:thioredoxin reductase (NADPH)
MAASEYDYDLYVIGGGSGGLASAKTAADLGARVGVADFVKPSPAGTTWGLGGTCVNVGCIPKKLMHMSALYRESQGDAAGLGWDTKTSHSWDDMITKVTNYIKQLQYGSKNELKSKKVTYHNAYGTFVDPHTLQLDNGKGDITKVTAKYILIACGGRPNLGGYPGAEECCISSDDIFWRKTPPGKTLVVGASYIALECAGFIAGLGFDTTVMVRSILLRGFDQDCANMIGDYMERHHVKFARGMVPEKFEKVGSQTRVYVDGKVYGDYDTVLLAIGRKGCAHLLNLEAAGVTYDAAAGKIKCENEQTNVPHIYAVGDVLAGRPELTPVAIQAGRKLVKRLFAGATAQMTYSDIATTVFTPLEYGTVGLSEEDAQKQFGKENIVTYHGYGKHLEWNTSPERAEDSGYFKVVCLKNESEKVVGFHMLGIGIGEAIQGIGVAMKVGFTKSHLDETVGIHPTFAEGYCTLTEVKEEGKKLEAKGGC